MAAKAIELDDDSALINAFNQAISKYKIMHGFKDTPSHTTTDIIKSSSEQDVSTPDNKSRPESVHDENMEVGESGVMRAAKENESFNTEGYEVEAIGSTDIHFQDQSQNYSSSLDVDEYNHLYQQYYEIEEQRQIILQKMHHLSNGHYPYSGDASASGLQWGTNAATQEFQPTAHMSGGTMAVSAESPATEKVAEKTSVDVDIVKTALGAAERALSTFKENTSDSKVHNKICSITEQGTDSETDLSTVLNAWYSAGFYTGKYLAEKSLSKKQQD